MHLFGDKWELRSDSPLKAGGVLETFFLTQSGTGYCCVPGGPGKPTCRFCVSIPCFFGNLRDVAGVGKFIQNYGVSIFYKPHGLNEIVSILTSTRKSARGRQHLA